MPGDDLAGKAGHRVLVAEDAHFYLAPIDRALENARRASDQAKRLELIAPVFQAIANDVPVVFLYFSDYLYAHANRLQGLRIMPIVAPSDRLWNAEDWYVKTSLRR